MKSNKTALIPSRHITTLEANCVKLLDHVEDMAEKKKYIGTLVLTEAAYMAMLRTNIAEPLKSTDLNNGHFQVVFDINQLYRYVKFACGLAGLTIAIDGTVKTKDGLTLERADIQ